MTTESPEPSPGDPRREDRYDGVIAVAQKSAMRAEHIKQLFERAGAPQDMSTIQHWMEKIKERRSAGKPIVGLPEIRDLAAKVEGDLTNEHMIDEIERLKDLDPTHVEQMRDRAAAEPGYDVPSLPSWG